MKNFIKVPLNMMYVMDNDCFKLLSLLIQKESYWKNKGKLENGFFFCIHNEIEKVLKINERDIPNVIEGLYRNGIIDVISNGFEKGKRRANRFKINWEKIDEFDAMSTTDIIEEGIEIRKCKRGDKLTYCLNEEKKNVEMSIDKMSPIAKIAPNVEVNDDDKLSDKLSDKMSPYYIYNRDNIYNKYKKEVNIKENIKEEYNIENFEKKLDIFKTIPSYHDKSLTEMRRCLRSSIEMGRISKEDISYIYNYLHKTIPSDNKLAKAPSDFEINSNNKYSYMLTQVQPELPF